MKSVLRSWRRKASPKTSRDDDPHLPLQYPINLSIGHAPSPSPTPSYSASSSKSAKPPVLSLASPFKEDFSHAVEEALMRQGAPEPRYTPNRRPHHEPQDSTRSAGGYIPSHHGFSQQTQNSNRYVPAGSPGAVQQTGARNPPTSGDLASLDPSQRAHVHSRPSETTAGKVRSPTHDNYKASHEIETSPQHSKLSFIQASNTHVTLTEGRQDGLRTSVSPSRRPPLVLEHGTSNRQHHSQVLKEEQSHRTIMAMPNGPGQSDAVDARSRRGLTATRSTPQLRPQIQNCNTLLPPLPPLPAEIPSPSDPNFVSFFPPPPPLIIRKKRPQPLVLQPKAEFPSSQPSESPNYSSPDSTPVATPQSSRTQFPASVSSPKTPIGRKASFLPPPVHSPPTSPLPSPPSIPQPPLYTQPPAHLKSSRSAINLRARQPPQSAPTHRMTSSDPISEVAGQPMKSQTSSPLKLDSANHQDVRPSSRRPDRKEGARIRSTQHGEPSVQWGYAL